jgi:nucleotide-binding universal stress UspA family protein
MRPKRILVPTDFSNYSLQALEDAIELAKPFKASIVLLHASDPIYFATPGTLYAPSGNVLMLMREWRRIARTQLAVLARDLEKRGVRLRPVFAIGAPHRTIVETAKKIGADLIVMSTHGRGGISHLVMGSVAEKVVRSAPCPVLTVRPVKAREPRVRASRRKHS